MSSVKSSSSLGEPNGKDDANDGKEGIILKKGYIKKLKTMKKKYFVLRGDSTENSVSTARIEYYDSEKKWRLHHAPKRSILLKTCFNINRKVDTKHKYVVALYTKDDCFCLVFDAEDEMNAWLKALLSLQHGEDVGDGESPKPTFEHVWQVTVAKRGLGSLRNILGPHLLCLTDKTLSLVKINQNEKTETYEFSLMNIRRCGDMESFFYMEVGRSSCTGAGDLWMQTEDTYIAQNMHAAIMHAMSNNSVVKEELGPRPRNRSSSANEASKPILVLQRRQTHAGLKPGSSYCPAEEVAQSVGAGGKTCCDRSTNPAASAAVLAQSAQVGSSLPGSFHGCHQYGHHRVAVHPPMPVVQRPSQRRHSVSAVSATPASAGPTHHRTHSYPLSEPSAPLPPWDTRRGSTGRTAKRSGNGAAPRSTTGTVGGRERCDSMPSRARTTSEGHHGPPLPHAARNVHLVPGHGRPHSMYTRGISYSPPVGSSPVSPNSGACSTDSAGSSLSVDDEHNWMETEPCLIGRYGHSLTPDEPIIFEENTELDDNTPCIAEESLDYMSMDRTNPTSLSLPIETVKPSLPMKFSPNLSSSGFKSGSPSASYLDMYSPCGSSPLDTVGAYMTMSPGLGAPLDAMTRYGRSVSSASHSRASSLAEDGYVPMAPGQNDDGYVDMDPSQPEQFGTGETSPGNSSCSIASGTPSTDLRFSEYPLEKVSSYFTPSEEEESNERPARAYSVGSRPGGTPKTRPPTECSRVRAFSVGSHCAKVGSRPLSRHVLTATPPSGKKSSSAPLLSHSWSGSPTLRPPLYASGEPMDDLMEMDFSKNSQKSAKNRTNLRNSRVEVAAPPSYPPPHDRLIVPLNNLSLSPNNLSTSPSSSQDTSGYMDMTPSRLGEPISNPVPIAPAKTFAPYVEMKPGCDIARSVSASPPQTNHLTRNILSASPKSNAAFSPPPSRTLVAARKPSVVGTAPYVDGSGTVFPSVRNAEAYMDMRGPQPQHFPTITAATHPPARPGVEAFARKPTSPIQEEYMEMNLKNVSNRSAPVDLPQPRDPAASYVDMSWGPGSNRGPPGDDYMNMSGEGRRRKERRGSRKDKQRFSSQPIAIQTNQLNEAKPGSSASTSPIFSLASMMTGRKTSVGTPPKIPGYLPLGPSNSASPGSSPYSSLQRRSRNRKTARRESTEVNVNIPTPTGSTSGIFPFSLNSPGSPMKALPGTKTADPGYEYNRKCPVDASSGTVCISYPYPDGSSGSNPVTPDSSSSSEQPTPVNAEPSVGMTKADASSTGDYVNYSPARRPITDVLEGDEYGEYAVMSPIATVLTTRKISTPVFSAANKVVDKQKKLSLSSLSSAIPVTRPVSTMPVALSSFRPIPPGSSVYPPYTTSLFKRQLSSTSASSTESGKSQEAALVTRQLSNSSVKDDGAYESLSGGVSPVPSQSSRPGSVTCDKELHYASLDLATEAEEGGASPRNFRTQGSLVESTPSPNPGQPETFTYAEIDFAKSENLKSCSSSVNRKVCH